MDSIDTQVRILLGPEAAPFESLLKQLMSAHNESRAQAEHFFDACKEKYPEILLMKLVHILQHGSEAGSRSMAAILLRKQINLWPHLGRASQDKVKEQLFSCLQTEEVRLVLKVLYETIAELAARVLDEDGWPELLPYLFLWSASENYFMRERALLVLAQLATHATSELNQHLNVLYRIYLQNFTPSISIEVQLAAFHAVANLVQYLDSSKERDLFQDLLPLMMQTVTHALDVHAKVVAREALETLIEVAGINPGFIRRHLSKVLDDLLNIAGAQEVEEGTRHLALELMLTLAEARERAPGMMRKFPQSIRRLFYLLLNLLLDIEDDSLWYFADTRVEDVSVSSSYEMGQECLDRLSNSLGGKIIMPIASELLLHYLEDGDWRKRHAALIMLAQIAEGCGKVMTSSLESIVDIVLGSFRDTHPRVRWAAINAMGQICLDLGSELQDRFHHRIVPALIDVVGDFQNPRVQAHAAAAIVNFCEGCNAEILRPWLDEIVSKLILLLQNGKYMAQECSLMALAAVADSAKSDFQRYYDAVMPYLKDILFNATDGSNRMLRAKSMECISLVGLAVGKEKFGHDAKGLVDVLMNLQTTLVEDDDPTHGYVLQAWGRICKCLGQDFLPYLNVVMPPLLQSAQLMPEVAIIDANTLDEETDIYDDGETVIVGDKRIVAKISMLEEKATACTLLFCYADELKEGFYPWLDQVVPILIPLLNFPYHEEIRMASVSAMPQLLHVGKSAVDKGLVHGRDALFVKKLSSYIILSLVTALHKEQQIGVLTNILSSLHESIQIFDSFLEDGLISSMVDEFKDVITASMSRKKERFLRKAAVGFDEEEDELLKRENADEESIFEQVCECLGTVVKLQKSSFVPYFNELVPFIIPILGKDRTAEERCKAICIFNDVADYCGAPATKFYDTFFPFLLEASADKDADVRQAALYGIGLCAKFGGPWMKPFIGEVLSKLNAAISHPSAFMFGNLMATDNAISALGKICEYQRNHVDAARVLAVWLSFLPIRTDLKEAKVLHQLFYSMVARSDPLLLGPNNQQLPKILSVFAEILNDGADLASEETLTGIVDLLHHLKQTLAPPSFASIWKMLSAEHQRTLHPVLAP